MDERNKTNNTLQTVYNVFDIINHIHEQGDVGVTELSNELGYAKSTMHSYLKTMEHSGYLVKEENRYDLSLQFLAHGASQREQIVPCETVRPILQQLAKETTEAVWFTVEERGRVRNIYKSRGERAISLDTQVGRPMPIHALAAGKAILSTMPRERVTHIVDMHGLDELTTNTITSREALFAELEEIREQEFALNEEEQREGIRSVAVPVEHERRTVGAIVVSGPPNRLRGDRFRKELPELVLGTVNELELRLRTEQ